MTTPQTPKPKFKRAKRVRKVVESDRAEYRGYFRLKDKAGNFIDRYLIQFSDGHGKRTQKRVRASSDKEAAELRAVEIARAREMQEKGTTDKATTDTFDQFADEFLRHQKGEVSEVEYTRQKGIVEQHLKPFFGKGGKRLSAISRGDVIGGTGSTLGRNRSRRAAC